MGASGYSDGATVDGGSGVGLERNKRCVYIADYPYRKDGGQRKKAEVSAFFLPKSIGYE